MNTSVHRTRKSERERIGKNVLLVVHGLHSGIGLRVLSIADKAKATATSSIAVLNHDLLRRERFVDLCDDVVE
jgi:hypothetical protein